MPAIVKIDKKKCVGCASCTLNAPEIFMMDPHGHSAVRKEYRTSDDGLQGEIPDELYEKAIRAMNSCLGSAIQVSKIKK